MILPIGNEMKRKGLFMIKQMNLFYTLTSLLLLMNLSSCLVPQKKSSKENEVKTIEKVKIVTVTTGTTTTTTTTTTTGSTCFGTTADGTGPSNLAEIIHFDVKLSGFVNWFPGHRASNFSHMATSYPGSYYAIPSEPGPAPDLYSGATFFKTDNILKLRFKINSEPSVTGNTQTCWKRSLNQVQDQYRYTKLRFDVSLRDVICNNPNIINPTLDSCQGSLVLGAKYNTQSIGPVDVNGCSPIIDFGATRNLNQLSTVVEVHNIRSDSGCRYFTEGGQPYYQHYCPAEKPVKEGSCYHMTMQLVTNQTKAFK